LSDCLSDDILLIVVRSVKEEIRMTRQYKTKIEITAPAASKDEAMEIVGDYLSGNIVSGIDMRCSTKRVRFYDNSAAKAMALLVVVGIGFLYTVKAVPHTQLSVSTCQTAAVQAPLKTSNVAKQEADFKKEWEEKQIREALDFIKK